MQVGSVEFSDPQIVRVNKYSHELGLTLTQQYTARPITVTLNEADVILAAKLLGMHHVDFLET